MQKYQFIQNNEQGPTMLNYGQLGACQLLRRRDNNQLCVLKLTLKQQAVKDIQYLTKMDHSNIIKVIDYFQHEDNTLIIFQFLAGGDLYTKIKCKQIKKWHIPSIFRGICSAILYVHSRKIIHRNLKSQTILLDQNMNPKIIDFGLAARLSTRKTFCGCYNYMAPEILNNRQYNDKADVWALGVILYQMIYGDVPFPGQNTYQVIKSIRQSHVFWRKFQKESVQSLINWMLLQDPSQRPSVSQVLNHPYLKAQPLKFIHPTQKQMNDKNMKPIKLKIIQNRLINKSSFRCNTFLQGMGKIINDKIEAFTDRQRFKGNSHYNFIRQT